MIYNEIYGRRTRNDGVLWNQDYGQNFANLLKAVKQGLEDSLARCKVHRREKASRLFFDRIANGLLFWQGQVIPKETVSGSSHKDRTWPGLLYFSWPEFLRTRVTRARHYSRRLTTMHTCNIRPCDKSMEQISNKKISPPSILPLLFTFLSDRSFE